ncbi:MAG TPA: hypothetical protein VK524_29985 [Polyangiaceae bacterium]|nr:hypothetical protein [Polyangiaceae bacterium]
MSEKNSDLRARAKARHAHFARRRRDPRYQRVIGRFKAAKLLITNDEVPEHREPITVSDTLWAGEVEPRLIELLPAAILKKPSLFVDIESLPHDLASVVGAIRRHETPPPLRGIPGENLLHWVPRIGHRGKIPSRLKSFRFTAEDLALLAELSRELDLSETETLRQALRKLAHASDVNTASDRE